jgi:hypothetical protein
MSGRALGKIPETKGSAKGGVRARRLKIAVDPRDHGDHTSDPYATVFARAY